MSINATTGDIIAAPGIQGFFTFAIRVEEFRDLGTGTKVKIGETRRDVQYNSQPCTSSNPPTFADTSLTSGQTLQIPYNKEYCRDFVITDLNATDTLYIGMVSPVFSLGAYAPAMIPDINGNDHYLYNWDGTSWIDSVVIPPNQYDTAVGADWNIGTVANRFCWTPSCSDIGQVYPFQVNGFSLGCDGVSLDILPFFIEVVPPNIVLLNPGDINIPY